MKLRWCTNTRTPVYTWLNMKHHMFSKSCLHSNQTPITLVTFDWSDLPHMVPLPSIMAHRRKRSLEWGQTLSRMAPVTSDTASCHLRDTTMIRNTRFVWHGFVHMRKQRMVEEAKCFAAMQCLEDCQSRCVTGKAVLAPHPWRLELVQHISVLSGSSKCSELSIVRLQ